MADQLHVGILRAALRTARTITRIKRRAWCGIALLVVLSPITGQATEPIGEPSASVVRHIWDFSRKDDWDRNDGWPDKWKRVDGPGYPKYVTAAIKPHNSSVESFYRTLDANVFRAWKMLRNSFPNLPELPPSVADAAVDRYLHIELDGGQLMMTSPPIPASRVFKYRFSCRMMTQGLRHDSARAEIICLDGKGKEIDVFSTPAMSGTNDWTEITLDVAKPPSETKQIAIRLHVQRGETGVEDVHGAIGFDDVTVEQYPQIQIFTDQARGIYRFGSPVLSTAKVLGLRSGISRVRFQLTDSSGQEIGHQLIQSEKATPVNRLDPSDDLDGNDFESRATWKLPLLAPGFYRVSASLVDPELSSLATETTFAVIDQLTDEPLAGPFGWTLPDGLKGMEPREAAAWLASLGVAWVKYPCWLHPDDFVGIDRVAKTLTKLQDAGIETVGMLDQPPDDQIPLYGVRGRRDLVAAQLFYDIKTWQPLLEPVMSRLTLSVGMWQLGCERDDSFLGRPRLRELIKEIAAGLQGFGQSTEVAISWPWLEPRLPANETSWQAVCRSSHSTLAASELDAALTKQESQQQVLPPQKTKPYTWLLLDPIEKDAYSQASRINDLVMRMATVRSHQVQASFVSNPYDQQHGLLRPDGRPSELLLPWRTTSQLIGNLQRVGSLQLRSGANNIIFAGAEREVLMVWSAQPVQELIFLGENVSQVDVWGKTTKLPPETVGNQTAQRLEIGPTPKFIIGADPELLAFRMSVVVSPKQLDSLLGRRQQMTVEFTNPTADSLIGTLRVLKPSTWQLDDPTREWEVLARKPSRSEFNVVLSNSAKVGKYEIPVQFKLETIPPKVLTTYRQIQVGPTGLEINVTTKMLPSEQLRVEVELTNRSDHRQAYDCMMFATPDRQYQRLFITVLPGETANRSVIWRNGETLLGKRMLLRADEQDGPRILNYPFTATR
ncbi:MAG: hypothetical protein P8L85_05115 [Rubripirellula sp.]|nr:hypothetical protein [Rubripirellula sp.]